MENEFQHIRNKKVLILYTSVGLGHKIIAENIGYWLRQAGANVRLEDVLQVQSGKLVSVGAWVHRMINRHFPFVWSWLYQSKWFTDRSLPYRVRVAGKNYQQTLSVIREFEPDVVLATQTTASAIIAYLKRQGLYQGLFGITFSDFHLHRYWLYDEADFYLANIPEQKEEMVRLGINANKISVCGITLPPKPSVDAGAVREKIGIKDSEKVILVSSGSQGIGLNADVIGQLLALRGCKVVVVCGKDAAAAERLKREFPSGNLAALGFYKPMDELYAIADVYVSKPGGLSTAEALRWQLPMLVTYVLPGQEELNYEYLQDKGLIMPEPVAVAEEALEEAERHAFRQSLAKNSSVVEVVSGPMSLLKAFDSVLESSRPELVPARDS